MCERLAAFLAEQRPIVGQYPHVAMNVLLYAVYLPPDKDAVAVMPEIVSVEAVKTGGGSNPDLAVFLFVDAVYC